MKEGETYKFKNLRIKKNRNSGEVYVNPAKDNCVISKCAPFKDTLAVPGHIPTDFITSNIEGQVMGINDTKLDHCCFKCNKWVKLCYYSQWNKIIDWSPWSCESPGIYNFSIKLIKFVSSYIAGPLEETINDSFINGCFPEKLKIQKIIPLHKGGSKLNITNFRPISFLPIFSKIIEQTMLKRLKHFLE